MTKLVIVGGVAGGATAASRARRLDEQAEIVLFERGKYLSFANCGLPYYVGGVIRKRSELLLSGAERFRDRYAIDARVLSEVTAIDPSGRRVTVLNHKTGETYEETYDRLILATGAEPIRPPLPGIDLPGIHVLRGIPDADAIKSVLTARKAKAAVVVGGGFIGLEMAENLAHRGLDVTIVEMLPQVMAPLDFEMAAMLHDHLRSKGINLSLGNGVTGFSEKGDRLVVSTRNGDELEADLVMLAIGVRPDTRLAREAGLEVARSGHVVVDQGMRTSDPDIFAVGDAVLIPDMVTGRPRGLALAGPANKQARIAANNAMGRTSVYRGALGVSAVKVFDLTAASVGANERTLKDAGMDYRVSFTHSGSHADYYPGAQVMSVKLLFAPDTGRILGAQIVGGQGVDKRIDVFATAIYGGLSVFDLEDLDLAYAPPFSSAKDPVNVAGYVAGNFLRGDLELIHIQDLAGLDPERDLLLDVRSREEINLVGKITGALSIPIDELRRRLPELDRGKRIVVYCAVGQRAYIAYRMLSQHGFEVRSLSGGFITYAPVAPPDGIEK